MNPREIAARICRPMSTEEAVRLTRERYGVSEFPDIDPLIEAQVRSLTEKIQREEAVLKAK
ncbi:hypothetical protein [Mitsuaria sp. GD03876]|uniref:hypothetical protein n=1 Tax=Mitsuaria sp. GD03876 TaxID=2975399 RepID=UPI00244C6F4B|nr:hypothetical protein [Mitsuaria sp. GD03876]MDH0863125.1 hypothetical protein [Mitsuaria sp. GD03876]